MTNNTDYERTQTSGEDREKGKAIVRFSLFACLTILIAVANPFGMREASDAESQAMAMHLLAPWVPADGRDDIVVVEISDKDLRHWQTNWPLSYDQMGQLLYTLGASGAKAVFYDGVFTQQRASPAKVRMLAQFLEMGQLGGTPIYLAGYPGRPDIPASSRDAVAFKGGILAPLAEASAGLAVITWSEKGENYPLVVEGEGGAWHPTPALLLYQSYCAQVKGGCQRRTLLDLASGGLPDMVRTWPSSLPPTAPWQILHASCENVGKGGWEVAKYSLTSFVSAVFAPSGSGPVRQPCLPYTILNGRDVWAPIGVDGAATVQDKLPFLADKLVLVGTRMKGLPDWEESPVHGSVTGVMSHAMALGNLIDFGGAYLREAPDVVLGLGLDDIVELGLLLLIIGRIARFQDSKSKITRPSAGVNCRGRGFWALAGGLIGGMCYFVGVFGWQHPVPLLSPALALSVGGILVMAAAFCIAPYEAWLPPPAGGKQVRFGRLGRLLFTDLIPFLAAVPLLLSVTLLMSVVLRFAPVNWLGILGLLLFVASYVLSDFFEEIVSRLAVGLSRVGNMKKKRRNNA